MHPNVDYSTVYNSQDTEATLMSINRWTDKEVVVHIYTEYYTAIKKNEQVWVNWTRWMNLHLLYRVKEVREKYISYIKEYI